MSRNEVTGGDKKYLAAAALGDRRSFSKTGDRLDDLGFSHARGSEKRGRVDRESRSSSRGKRDSRSRRPRSGSNDLRRREERSKRKGKSQRHRSESSSASERSSKRRVSSRSKKSKRRRKKKEEYTGMYEWGKYGLIQESDQWEKKPEFQAWLLEVKDVHSECLSSMEQEEKNLFRTFVEDFNTATLPHKKFYDLEKWEREGLKKIRGPDSGSFDDERIRQVELQSMREELKKKELSTAYKDIREDYEKIKAMRSQKMLQTQMKTLFQMGRVEEAQRIRDRLKPDEPSLSAPTAADSSIHDFVE